MIKIRRKTKRRLLIILLFLIAVLIGTMVYTSNNNEAKSEYEIALEKELKEVNKLATKAWSKAITSGKKDETEIIEYIKVTLEKEELNPNDYYYTLNAKGVTVAKKHPGLLAEPGYYKSGTNFLELIKDWEKLINTRGINVVEGRLGLLRKDEEKIDVVVDNSITEIKDRIVESELKIGTIIIPESVTTLSNIAFKDAEIEEIVLNTKLTEFDGHFKDIRTLEKITFTGDIKVIRGKAFNNTNIKEVNFIGNVEQLVSIKYVTYFDVPSYNKECLLYINGVLADEIVIPNTITEIKDYALHNYTNLKKITIPTSVKYIGTGSITGTGIREVVYEGTIEMWNDIAKMEEWVFNEIDCTVYCTDGNVVYGKGE